MVIMSGISLCVLVACLVRGIYDHMEDYDDDCEVQIWITIIGYRKVQVALTIILI